jgi:hypothetical protein
VNLIRSWGGGIKIPTSFEILDSNNYWIPIQVSEMQNRHEFHRNARVHQGDQMRFW